MGDREPDLGDYEQGGHQPEHHNNNINDQNNNQGGSDPFIIIFRILSGFTIIAALLCTAVNIISVVRSFQKGRDIFEGILRLYAVLIALFVAVAELEIERVNHLWRVLEIWVGRGLLQIFVAVMTKALSSERKDKAYQVVLAEVASGMMLVCGAIYFIAGLFCAGKFKQSRYGKTNWREKTNKEIQDLEKRKEELQALLAK